VHGRQKIFGWGPNCGVSGAKGEGRIFLGGPKAELGELEGRHEGLWGWEVRRGRNREKTEPRSAVGKGKPRFRAVGLERKNRH